MTHLKLELQLRLKAAQLLRNSQVWVCTAAELLQVSNTRCIAISY